MRRRHGPGRARRSGEALAPSRRAITGDRDDGRADARAAAVATPCREAQEPLLDPVDRVLRVVAGQAPRARDQGEMWFGVTDQPIFAVAGFWQAIAAKPGFAMVMCDPNELVAPIHPKAMITVLEEADWDKWLTSSYEDAVALQRPYPT